MSTNKKIIRTFDHFYAMADLFALDLAIYLKKRGTVQPPVEILVPNKETENWLKPFLTTRLGILANIRFMLPFEWLWHQIRALNPNLPEVLASEKGPMVLSIYRWLLRKMEHQKKLENTVVIDQKSPKKSTQSPFVKALSNLPVESRFRALYSLSTQIAAVLDGYQNYRPEMLHRWELGDNPKDDQVFWQAELWRDLVQEWSIRLSEFSDRPNLFLSTLAYFSNNESELQNLSNEVESKNINSDHFFLFHAGLMPQPILSMIEKRSYKHGSFIYSLLRVKKTLLSERFSFESEAILHSFKQLDSFKIETSESLNSDAGNVKTSCLLEIKETQESILARHHLDSSIEMHSCHSELREIEVLHQAIYSWLSSDPTLKPSDIFVVTPDLDVFLPFISAVFDQEDDAVPKIPFWIPSMGRSEKDELNAFLAVISLLKGRFEPDNLFEILRYPSIMRRFKLTLQDIDLISSWITENRVLWGMDADHKRELNQPHDDSYTWNQFFSRAWNSILWGTEIENPHSGDSFSLYDSEDKRILIHFQEFIHFLNEARMEVSRGEKTFSEWIQLLQSWIQTLFLKDSDTSFSILSFNSEWTQLLKSIDMSNSDSLRISFDVLALWIQALKTDSKGGTARFGQGVVFSSMVPLRGIPARVICMIGVDESRFPRKVNVPDFDLLNQKPRFTERDRKREDRQLFYESMMAAKEKFYLSYIGQNPKDNSKIEPSPVIVEFLDLLTEVFPNAHFELPLEHPLNGFSTRYFDQKSPLANRVYLQRFVRTAKLKSQTSMDGSVLENAPTEEALSKPAYTIDRHSKTHDALQEKREKRISNVISLHDLISFYKNPTRSYLKHNYDVNIEMLLDRQWEFEPDYMTRHRVRQYILAERLSKKREADDLLNTLREASLLPVGISGDMLFSELFELVEQVDQLIRSRSIFDASHTDYEKLNAIQTIEVEEFTVSLQYRDYKIEGELHFYASNEQRFYCSLSKSKGKNLIEFWINHLVASSVEVPPIHFVWMGRERLESFQFQPLTKEKALQQLETLLDLFEQGHRTPVRFFPNSAAEWYQKNSDGKQVISDDLQEWSRVDFNKKIQLGEAHDEYVKLLYGESASLDSDSDFLLFEQIMTPIFLAMKESK